MRDRRTSEEVAGNRPVIYKRNNFGRYFNDRGEDVTAVMLSTFPWRDDEDGDFEWKRGWTRIQQFYVDDMLTRESVSELISTRFFHARLA